VSRSRLGPALVGLAAAALAVATTAPAFDGVMPVPVPGSSHIFAPGPKRLGLQGPKANPSSIGDFDGTIALVYLKGRATGADGRRFLMVNDMRLMTGAYRAADGSQHRGTFAFV
jgi:hypothetical protein